MPQLDRQLDTPKRRLAWLEAILDCAVDAIITIDERGTVHSFNPPAERIFGYEPSEVIGKRVEMLMPEPHRSEHESYLTTFFSTGRKKAIGTRREVKGRRKDGAEFPLEISVAEVRSIQGRFFTALLHDITERRKAEESLRLTQFAVDHCSDAIYWVRADGRISYVNRSACEQLGYSYAELVSMSVPEIAPDFPQRDWPEHWDEIKRAGAMTFEAHHRTKDGEVFPVEITTNHLVHQGEEYIWAYVRNISERKRAEEKLRRREAEFAHATRLSAVSELATGIAPNSTNRSRRSSTMRSPLACDCSRIRGANQTKLASDWKRSPRKQSEPVRLFTVCDISCATENRSGPSSISTNALPS